MSIMCIVHAEQCTKDRQLLSGAYEPPKAAKERVTSVPSEYKSLRTCAYIFPAAVTSRYCISSRKCSILSIYGSFFEMNLYSDGTRAYAEVTCSFGGS